jgi:cell division protein ZapE
MELLPDPDQALAVEKLQSLHVALERYDRENGLKGWKDRFGLGHRRKTPPQGLYMFGGVGRGKSMLMDLFFSTAPIKNKRRVHFHAFMQQVHQRLNEYRRWEGRSDDPIPPIAKRFAKDATLLCFDEFQVHDIADAMILSRLFKTLFDEGVVVVVTSNRPPSDLYKDGLQRALFLPFIGLIEEKLDLLMLDGPTDYRRETIQRVGMYLVPNNKKAEATLRQLFERLTSEAIILGIPQLSSECRNEAKRFVILIDALYENGVKLICSADVAPSELYVKGDGAFEFERTASRLIEMQSEEYLCKGHAA